MAFSDKGKATAVSHRAYFHGEAGLMQTFECIQRCYWDYGL